MRLYVPPHPSEFWTGTLDAILELILRLVNISQHSASVIENNYNDNSIGVYTLLCPPGNPRHQFLERT